MAENEIRVRKSLRLRQDSLDRARQALGTTSDRETVERALEWIVDRWGPGGADTPPGSE